MLDLKDLGEEIRTLKQSAIDRGDEDEANGFLALELIARGLQSELQCYPSLKGDNPGGAWDFIIDAEKGHASRDAGSSYRGHLTDYISRIQVMQELLFPKQRYFSAGWIIESSKCSICRAEYGECDHIAGRPYLGQLCARVVEKGRIAEISIVDHSSDKHCRVVSFSDGSKDRDAFTLRVAMGLNSNKGPKSDMETTRQGEAWTASGRVS